MFGEPSNILYFQIGDLASIMKDLAKSVKSQKEQHEKSFKTMDKMVALQQKM